tara:strand:+ start:127043 stop:127558 length:516 start_codon:yes stop_codon:yes gene_type:complete
LKKSYCAFCNSASAPKIHSQYHKKEYGINPKKDKLFFEALVLEINQTGLSWDLVLKRRNTIKLAFENYNLNKISNFNKKNINDLLSNNKIIRNKKKIIAIIYNSKIFIEIIKDNGSFKKWMDKNKNKSLDQWIKLFKKKFKFTGPSVTKEFLIATGYIAGAHDLNCIYNKF